MNKLIIEKYPKNTTVLENNIFMNSSKCTSDVFITHLYSSSSEKRRVCFLNK